MTMDKEAQLIWEAYTTEAHSRYAPYDAWPVASAYNMEVVKRGVARFSSTTNFESGAEDNYEADLVKVDDGSQMLVLIRKIVVNFWDGKITRPSNSPRLLFDFPPNGDVNSFDGDRIQGTFQVNKDEAMNFRITRI